MRLEEVFDPRRNSLDAWRLILASEVMMYHSFAVTGRLPPDKLVPLVFGIGVDGFFAISGFLIIRSWLNRPNPGDYLAARGLRVLPGLWVCLIVTAFVIAPLGVLIQGGSVKNLLWSSGAIRYVLNNFLVVFLQPDINGTPAGVPMVGLWNGSLWSLTFEVGCYLAVMILGVVGLAKYRWVSVLMLGLGVVTALSLPPLTVPGQWTLTQLAARTAIMFAAGALLYQWRDVIPANWWLVIACTAIVVAAGVLLPDYRVVAGLPLAYAVVVSGALFGGLKISHDISYGIYIYAFPVQQLLAMAGLVWLNPFLFLAATTLCTVPLAAASWFLIEKRAMRLKNRLTRKARPHAAPARQG
jgi:peptidoglycan/LPS O-acetylase OafA/YrhL